ncbi:hypothetical protein, partial [Aeromonas sp. QDB37]|uniref:hypothetical protein n=1 Tax=Aeromonas sp. QDB37 TaxID=2989829 RepID=UPI0022E638FF
MICAVSSSSITTLMLNQQMNSSVNAFKFVLSHHFIEHINVKFQNDPARLDLFKQWLAYRANFENRVREGANKRGNSSRLTQSFHFFSLSRS